MAEPVIRRATEADAAALAQMRFEFRATLNEPNESAEQFLERCTAWMAAQLHDKTWLCWVAESDGRLVGNAWLHLIDKLPNPVSELEKHGYISSVYVVPEARAGGLGQRLVAAALDYSQEMEVDSVILWPTDRSRSLY